MYHRHPTEVAVSDWTSLKGLVDQWCDLGFAQEDFRVTTGNLMHSSFLRHTPHEWVVYCGAEKYYLEDVIDPRHNEIVGEDWPSRTLWCGPADSDEDDRRGSSYRYDEHRALFQLQYRAPFPRAKQERQPFAGTPKTIRWLKRLTGRKAVSEFSPNQLMWIASHPELVDAPLTAQNDVYEHLKSRRLTAFLPIDIKKRIEWNIRHAIHNGDWQQTLDF